VKPAIAPEGPARQAVMQAILLMLVTVLLFAGMNGFNKFLTQDYHPAQILWARYLFQVGVSIAFGSAIGMRPMLVTARPGLQIVRAVLLAVSSIFFVIALKHLPLAEVEALGFTAPLFVTALAVPLLGEKVGIRRWTAVIVGFIGVLVIVRPGFGTMTWPSALAVLTALCYALYQIVTRVLYRTDRSETTLFYSSVIGMLLMAMAAPFFWRAPDLGGWMLMFLSGVFGGVSHFMLIKAIERAPTSWLQPFSYTQIVWAILIGLIVFGEVPDLRTIIGATIIVASGLYIVNRERARGKSRT
jgi:drug/metabolite transporter (DMT)-like permease